jgi:hypothetical protein
MDRRGGWVLLSFFLLLASFPFIAPAGIEREIAFGFLVVVLLVPIHELGHVVAFWLVGYRLTFVRYGWGETFARIRLFDVDIEVLNTPFGAGVNGCPRQRRRFSRLRHWVVVSGGLLAQLALDRTLVAILGDSLWSFQEHPLAAATAWVNRLVFAINAFPYRAPSGAVTDGYMLLTLPFRRPAYVEAIWTKALDRECKTAVTRGEFERVLAIGRAARDLFTRRAVGDIWMGASLLWLRRHEEARAVWREGLSHASTPGDVAWFKSQLALAAVLLDREADLAAAEQFSRESVEATPLNKFSNRARAAVLLKLGRTAEAWPFAEVGCVLAETPMDRGYSWAIAAVAHASRGEVELARRALDAARAADGECELLGWAEASIAKAAAQPAAL